MIMNTKSICIKESQVELIVREWLGDFDDL
jgi:hypothetical protein